MFCLFGSFYSVHSPRMLSAADIALSTCEVTLKPQSCSRRDCGRKVVRLTAVSDFFDDGDRRTRIITEPARSQSSLWKLYDPADVFVSNLPISSSNCAILPYLISYRNIVIKNNFAMHDSLDQCMFLGHCPPTPPQT